jgi:very-short-patch-repair endonuclease
MGAGLSEAQVALRARRAWERVLPGVYRLRGSEPSWLQHLQAVALWAGSGSVFSHGTAAALWDFARFRDEGVPVHLMRRSGSERPCETVEVHVASALTGRDVRSHRGFRVTSPSRTLLDLAAVVDPATLRATVDEALRRKLTTVERLEAFCLEHSSHRGIRRLRALTRELVGGDGPTESELEARVEALLASAGLPVPTRQRTVIVGRRLRRLDFVFPGTRVVIEADGYAWHSSPLAFEKDRERLRALTARGYRVLQWTWQSLEQTPEVLLEELRAVLSREGVRQAA